LNSPFGVAVDGAGSVYIADAFNNYVKELPRVFVDPTPRSETSAAGSDVLPSVLPDFANLLPPFAPTTDQPWLTITGIADGVISFSFSATTSNRTANISLLGQTIPISQTVVVTPPILSGATLLGDGSFQFSFTNNQGATFRVYSTTNLSLPLADWTMIGSPTNVAPGVLQFTTAPTTNDPHRFYRVGSPSGL
jgi:hypothetical protein